MKIFVSLGTQKFQFNRLLKSVDDLCKDNQTFEAFAQIGNSDYMPKNYKFSKFLTRDEFNEKINESDIVVTHAGTGAIISALKSGKKVIAFSRLAKYGEHVDDHQTEILSVFCEKKYILGSKDTNDLKDLIKQIFNVKLETFESNTSHFVKELEKLL